MDMARQTAHRFLFVEESIGNLSSNKVAHQLRGCQQAHAYKYEPTVPLLLDLLREMSPALQYSALRALANFEDPQLVLSAFETIEHSLLVNDRTIREIIVMMGDRKTELFDGVFQRNSPILVPLFLKFIDTNSANVYLELILEMAQSEDMDLRIAAIRALAQSRDERVVPELIEALQAEDWEIRAAAAKALQSVPNQEVDVPLLHAVCDSSWWVRQNAATAALLMPHHRMLVKEIFLLGDAYAMESLRHAADNMDMIHIIQQVEEEIALTEPTQTPVTEADSVSATGIPTGC